MSDRETEAPELPELAPPPVSSDPGTLDLPDVTPPILLEFESSSGNKIYTTQATLDTFGRDFVLSVPVWANRDVLLLTNNDYAGPPLSEDPMFPPTLEQGNLIAGQMKALILANPHLFPDIDTTNQKELNFAAVSITNLTSDPRAISIENMEDSTGQNVCTVHLGKPDRTPKEWVSTFIGVNADKLENIDGTQIDWWSIVAKHEAAGHCALRHDGKSYAELLQGELEADLKAIKPDFDASGSSTVKISPDAVKAFLGMRSIVSARGVGIPFTHRGYLSMAELGINKHAMSSSFTDLPVDSEGRLETAEATKILNANIEAATLVHGVTGMMFDEEKFVPMSALTTQNEYSSFMNELLKSGSLDMKDSNELRYTPFSTSVLDYVDRGAKYGYVRPDVHYAVAKAMLNSGFFDDGVFTDNPYAKQYVADYVAAIEQHVPSQADPEMVAKIEQAFADTDITGLQKSFLRSEYPDGCRVEVDAHTTTPEVARGSACFRFDQGP